MTEILICWVGATDLKSSLGKDLVGLGPIAQAAMERSYDEVALISDYTSDNTAPYIKWLQGKTTSKITISHKPLSSPTDFGEIYQAASTIVSEKIKEYGSAANLVFHLSPGTPAIAAVWILLAKTRFPAKLIESSKEHGVRIASVPFDISAEFFPSLLRKPDSELARLAAGLPTEAPEFDDIIYRSEVMQRVILKARRVAPRSIPVLIEGESGTGKELMARAIHKASPRMNKPFIAINCGAIPAELVESELFGHEKGAFTGAAAARVGHFEAANGGTLLLDEVGELPKDIQVKLLRALQEEEIKRIALQGCQHV
jgi:transcriptional regulator with GAF, ATPase, and Fis domain